MTWHDMFRMISAVLFSFAGAASIMWPFSNFLGNLWAKRYLEKIKSEHQKELERYRTELDLIKNSFLRYSDKQFELYSSLWEALCELKFSAEMLWREANHKNLINFSEKLRRATEKVEKSYLFIKEETYYTLSDLLREFSEYEIGKRKIVDLKRSSKGRWPVNNAEIRKLVEDNRTRKEKYIQILDNLGRDLKEQLRGNV